MAMLAGGEIGADQQIGPTNLGDGVKVRPSNNTA